MIGPRRRFAGRRWSARRSARGDKQAVQQQRAAVEPQLLLAMPGAGAGPAADGKLAQLIDDGFGGAEALLEKLAGRGGQPFLQRLGWLVLDRGSLRITSLHDADTPLVHDGMVPLFTLDVWEHAYYIDYRNERPQVRESGAARTSSIGTSSRRTSTAMASSAPTSRAAPIAASLLLQPIAGPEHPGDHRHADGDDRQRHRRRSTRPARRRSRRSSSGSR